MTRDETIALFLQGKEAWNAWAEELTIQKAELERTGCWLINGHIPVPGNEKTKEWIDRAEADFENCAFRCRGEASSDCNSETATTPENLVSVRTNDNFVNFSGFIFPWKANFCNAVFDRFRTFDTVTFWGDAWFGRTKFCDSVWFDKTVFKADAWFEATFEKGVAFERASFKGKAQFDRSVFQDGTSFRNSIFESKASFSFTCWSRGAFFREAVFLESAEFISTTFADYASFKKVIFCQNGGSTVFRQAQFRGPAAFSEAEFHGPADFSGMRAESEQNFAGARFDFPQSAVPKFNQADFRQAPDLDRVSYPLPSWWKHHTQEDISAYRHLRRLAIQAHDHENESKAFKGEVRSKRFTEHKWHDTAFWYGVAYDALSDFGRSIARPFYIWLASIIVFAAFYALVIFASPLCSTKEPLGAALQLALKNGLVLVSWEGVTESESLTQCFKALQGAHGAWYMLGIAALQLFHKLWSAVLIFLFLLAARNQFKIK
jgi:hypothetical protein